MVPMNAKKRKAALHDFWANRTPIVRKTLALKTLATGNEKKEAEAEPTKPDAKPASAPPPKALTIDFEGLNDRVARAPIGADNYGGLAAKAGHLLYFVGPQYLVTGCCCIGLSTDSRYCIPRAGLGIRTPVWKCLAQVLNDAIAK